MQCTSRVLHSPLKVALRDDLSFLERREASPLLVARSRMRATTSSIPGERLPAAAALLGSMSDRHSSPGHSPCQSTWAVPATLRKVYLLSEIYDYWPPEQ